MTTPRLCVTVTGATTAELRRRRDEAPDADLVELRLDTVADPDAAGALSGRSAPVIVTCRPTWEGGHFRGSEEERKRILSTAITLGAEYVDIEWQAGWTDLIEKTRGRGVIVSTHDFERVPADLATRIRTMRSAGAEVTKAAALMTRLSDCVALHDVATEVDGDNLVLLGMGDHGITTRILPARFRSSWTYAGSIERIGQVSAESMIAEYRFRSIDDSTAVYGVVGRSVSHSVSPAMHNAAFRALGINAVYLPLPAESAGDFVEYANAFGIRGASVTIPHKVALLEHVDDLEPAARRIGAINTVRIEDGRWIGGNTDASGFLEPLKERLSLAGQRASVLGAGGAARAVVVALASAGCHVRIHARNRARAQAIVDLASTIDIGPWPPDAGSWDLLVNCTPIGQYPRAGDTPVPIDQLTGRCVYDLVYNPTTTRLLREAAAVGCRTIGGLEMLVAQAEEQFRMWTGVRPPAGVMRDAGLKRLAEFSRDEDHVV